MSDPNDLRNLDRVIKFKRVNDDAITPTKGSTLAAGYDLTSVENVMIPPGGRVLVDTGIQMSIKEGWYGRIAPRSGLAIKNGLDIGGGVVDADYGGNIRVIIFNHNTTESFYVTIRMKIAQIIFERCGDFILQEVNILPPTERGKAGFGSTGLIASPISASRSVESINHDSVYRI